VVWGDLLNELNPIESCYRRLQAKGRSILKLFTGNPNEHGIVFPTDILQDAYQHFFKAPLYHPHPKGQAAARQAIADYYLSQRLPFDPENILLTSGTSESFLQIFAMLAEPGDNVLVPNPSYPLFEPIAGLLHLEIKHYQLDETRNWQLDFASLDATVDAKTRALVLVSPNNPTGSVHDDAELEKLIAWAKQRELAIVCDEVFAEFFFAGGALPRPASHRPDLLFTLNGISKMFALPAMKLSWIAVSGQSKRVRLAVEALETSNDTFLTCNSAIQAALPELFARGMPFLEGYRAEVERRLGICEELLGDCPGLRWVKPRGGFYLTVEVLEPRGLSEEAWVIRLMEQAGVFVHPGYFFDYEQGVHFVISFLTEEATLREALGRLRAFLSAQPNP